MDKVEKHLIFGILSVIFGISMFILVWNEPYRSPVHVLATIPMGFGIGFMFYTVVKFESGLKGIDPKILINLPISVIQDLIDQSIKFKHYKLASKQEEFLNYLIVEKAKLQNQTTRTEK